MAENSLYNRLKKLFSTQVVVRRVGKNKLKVVDSSRLQVMVTVEALHIMIDMVDYMVQTQERIGKHTTNDSTITRIN